MPLSLGLVVTVKGLILDLRKCMVHAHATKTCSKHSLMDAGATEFGGKPVLNSAEPRFPLS